MEELKGIVFEDATDLKERMRIEEFYKVHPEKTLKTLVLRVYYKKEKAFIAVVLRGDLKVDLEKLKQELGLVKSRFASKEEMDSLELVMGYVSPIDCKNIKVIGDKSIEREQNYYDGGNKLYLYRKNVNYPRDFEVCKMLDISKK